MTLETKEITNFTFADLLRKGKNGAACFMESGQSRRPHPERLDAYGRLFVTRERTQGRLTFGCLPIHLFSH